jgi:subtilisin family serine protease
MARTLKEVAPGVEVYALGTYSSDEEAKVDAMVRAIDWAIDNGLDVLTYSARRFSPEVRERLDVAVDRAHANGIATVFIHYPHPGNILPTWLGPVSGDDQREPDLNILQYDYSVVFTKEYAEWMEADSESGYRPFLSISSTSPVTAGAVAILKALEPELTPAEIRRLLMETSYKMEFEGMHSGRTMDIGAAVQAIQDQGKGH